MNSEGQAEMVYVYVYECASFLVVFLVFDESLSACPAAELPLELSIFPLLVPTYEPVNVL